MFFTKNCIRYIPDACRPPVNFQLLWNFIQSYNFPFNFIANFIESVHIVESVYNLNHFHFAWKRPHVVYITPCRGNCKLPKLVEKLTITRWSWFVGKLPGGGNLSKIPRSWIAKCQNRPGNFIYREIEETLKRNVEDFRICSRKIRETKTNENFLGTGN